MAAIGLYPENLRDLALGFEEAIYVIVFELENEVREKGKEEIFQELKLTPEQMRERVNYCLDQMMLSYEEYALRRVLGDLNSSQDSEKLGGRTLGECFEGAMETLKSASKFYHNDRYRTNFRQILAYGVDSEADEADELVHSANWEADSEVELVCSSSADELYAEIQRLMDEVKMYDRMRNLALENIEKLTAKLKQRGDCPKVFGVVQPSMASQEIDLDGPVIQVNWPYRSQKILASLELNTMRKVVDYFQDFQHFVQATDITLLEWLVVTTILRKVGLLEERSPWDTFKLDNGLNEIDLSPRAYNCLARDGINSVSGLVMVFSSGANSGWSRLRGLRGLGKISYREIMERLGEIAIDLELSICFVARESDVMALDFSEEYLMSLRKYGLTMVGKLADACQDTNRFTGLRYIDKELYTTAKILLARHRF